jgi:hypothetical protein
MGNGSAVSSDHLPNAEAVCKLFSEFLTSERHFNELQSRYRTMASGWLLAVFGAVGFILTKTLPSDILPDKLLIIALIGLGGALGILLLWNLDLRVYHKLLLAGFDEGKKFEQVHPWLPQIHQEMEKYTHTHRVTRQVAYFYWWPDFVLLLMTAWSLIKWFLKPAAHLQGDFIFLSLAWLILLALSFILFFSTGFSKKVNPYTPVN